MNIPLYQQIIVFAILVTINEFVFEHLLKIRTKLQKKITSKLLYFNSIIIFIAVIAVIKDCLFDLKNYQVINLEIIAILVFFLETSNYTKERKENEL